MSFILDALKKAESERNRRVAPVLMDARVAPQRRALPPWAWALSVVLLVNLGVLAWLLLREPAPAAGPDAAQIAPAVTGSPAADASAVPQTPASPPVPVAPGTSSTVTSTATPPAPAPAVVTPVPLLDPQSAFTEPRNLPTLRELRAIGVPLPELQLNLHVYDPAPALRSVLLNGQRLREGEYSPEGVKLERVTPEGAVLEAAGRRFRLDAGH